MRIVARGKMSARVARRVIGAALGVAALAGGTAAAADPSMAQVDAIFARWAGKDAPGCAVAV